MAVELRRLGLDVIQETRITVCVICVRLRPTIPVQ